MITEGCSGNGCSGDGRSGNGVYASWVSGVVVGHCRRVVRSAIVALLLALGVSLLQSGPALALSQRGHAYSFHFGSFSGPAGLAVDNATGDVYVSEHNNKRVEEFEPALEGGELVGEKSIGQLKVSSPGAIAVDNSNEAADPSSGDVYVVSAGKAIYKFDAEGEQLEIIKAFEVGAEKARKFSAIEGVAVDRDGNLYVYEQGGELFKFNDAAPNVGISEILTPPETPGGAHRGTPAFAVDATGDFYVGDAGEAGDSPVQAEVLREVRGEYEKDRAAIPSEAVFSVVAKLDGAADQILTPALDYEFTAAVAVNPSSEPSNDVAEGGDAYLVNVAGVGGEKSSTVAEIAPESGEHEKGEVIQRFGTPALKEGDAVAVDAKTGAVYVADAATGSEDVDVFELEKRGPPTVEGVSAEVSSTSAGAEKLSAKVDPRGLDTDYSFEYGAESCSQLACTQTAPVNVGEGFGDSPVGLELPALQPGLYYFRVVATNGEGKVHSIERTFTVLAAAAGLPDGRAWELVSPPDKDGAEPEALTREGGLIEASEGGGAITYVADGPMPANVQPEGNRSPEYSQILSTRGPHGWTSRDITTPNSTGSGVEAGEPPEYQSFSPNLALALVQPAPGPPGSGALADPPLSPPLAAGEQQDKTMYVRAVQPLDDEELSPLQPEESEAKIYEAAAKASSPGYVALVTALDTPGGGSPEFGGGIHEGLEFLDATPHLGGVVFKSWKDAPGIYEWDGLEKPLQAISVLPTQTLAGPTEASLGGPEGVDTRHAISSEGTLVFWTTNVGSQYHLFVRDTATEETLQLDTFQGVSEAGQPPAEAIFQTASASGSKVFFTDTQRLTPNSRAVEGAPDLYVAELTAGAVKGSPLAIALTDLTPQEGAKVLAEKGQGGGVLGASEETTESGFNVFFAADGALAPGATRGYCRYKESTPSGTTCNLYMRHFNGSEWEPTKFITALSFEDRPDWQSDGEHDDLTELTSRVSPNGEYLAFMSDRSLTGYDNEDRSSAQAGEKRLDEEVYLYDVASERITCASCNPGGTQPTGVFDTINGGEGIGLVVDRPRTWEKQGVDHWLAGSLPGWTSISSKLALYQSQYLSNGGRLFFDSADALVPVALATRPEVVDGQTQEVGVENVYEYEPDGLGGCTSTGGCVGLISSGTSGRESSFLDASTSGNDVFFLTSQPLALEDTDSNFDVYDAHLCESASPCVTHSAATSSACEREGGEACQPYTPPPVFGAPGTATIAGSSNLVEQVHVLGEKVVVKPTPKPLTRAQKLAKALKACKKDRKKGKRVACDRQARKRYGPVRSKAKGKPSASKSSAGKQG